MQEIHETAEIHPSATIAEGVKIGPFCNIGKNVEIKEGVTIGARCVIEAGAVIEQSASIAPSTYVGRSSWIGIKARLQEKCVIGGIGYGYAQDEAYNHIPIPQMGRVEIGENGVVGSNSAIDRAAFISTQFKKNSSLGTNCHIAHNVIVGEGSELGSVVVVAGSTKIGKSCRFHDHVSVTGHKTISAEVELLTQAVVHNHIPDPGTYQGHPLQKSIDQTDLMETLGDEDWMGEFLKPNFEKTGEM